ncbi:hypothetical protein ACO0QE_004409 [Hanseniaspora vineae]
MELKSECAFLQALSLEELLDVQEDVVNLIREKVLKQNDKLRQESPAFLKKPDSPAQTFNALPEELLLKDEVIESSQNFDPTSFPLNTLESASGSSTQECVRTHLYQDSSQPEKHLNDLEETLDLRKIRSAHLDSSPYKVHVAHGDGVRENRGQEPELLKGDSRYPGFKIPSKRRKNEVSPAKKRLNTDLMCSPEKIQKKPLAKQNSVHLEPPNLTSLADKTSQEYQDELLPSASQLPPVIYKLTDLRKFQLRRDELRKLLNHTRENENCKDKTSSRLVNLNRNPITLGEWRIQDFVVNEESLAYRASVKKKSRKYHEDQAWEQFQNGKEVDKRYLYMFDNMKDREPEPPGYWRIMWPSTQENEQDKREMALVESQKIEERFHKAVNYKIPEEEREYLFKEKLLNLVVNGGRFHFQKHNLGIKSKKLVQSNEVSVI